MPPTQRSASSFSCMQSYRSVLLAGGGGRRVGGGGRESICVILFPYVVFQTDNRRHSCWHLAVMTHPIFTSLHNARDASCKPVLQFTCTNCHLEQVSPSPLASWCVVFIVASVFVESTVYLYCLLHVLKPPTSNIAFSSSSRGSCVFASLLVKCN